MTQVAKIPNTTVEPIFSPDLQKRIATVAKAATKLPAVISTPEERAVADDVIKAAKQLEKEVSDVRMTFSRPLDDKKAELMNLEKAIIKPAADAAKNLTAAVNNFIREEARKAADERKRIQDEADAKLRRLRSANSIAAVQQTTEAALEEVQAQPAGTRKIMKYEVIDLNLVPRELLTVDDAKIQDEMKRGTVSVPGLRIYPDFVRSGR